MVLAGLLADCANRLNLPNSEPFFRNHNFRTAYALSRVSAILNCQPGKDWVSAVGTALQYQGLHLKLLGAIAELTAEVL